MFSYIKGFLLNLKNIKEKISKNDLSSLPLLGNTKLPTNFNCKFYFQKVDELFNEFERRFLDFKKFEKQFRILSNPFQKIQYPPGEIDDELIYLNESEFEKGRFYNKSNSEDELVDYYKNLSSSDYPKLKLFSEKHLTIFGSTYDCEKLFPKITLNKNIYRSRLTEDNLNNVMRLLTKDEIQILDMMKVDKNQVKKY